MRTLLFALALGASAASTPSLVPLNDLGTAPYKLGYYGGLYENGSNVMAADHFALGLAAASRIQPLDAEGHPSPDGKIGFIAIGPGEAARIMQSFITIAASDVRVAHDKLVLLNGAREGADYRWWAERPDGIPRYSVVQGDTLAPAGVTPQQVQVAWVQIVKDSAFIPLLAGAADADPYYLKAFIGESLREMKRQYPNLQIAYLSSRSYGGYSSATPEPFAFESAYSNRWIITTQMEQERLEIPEWHWDTRSGLLDDSRRGAAPWLAWGPYLWANGEAPRSDGLTWMRGDFEADGDTLSPSGAVKGAKLLLDFLLHEPTAKGWFASGVQPVGRGRAARH